MTKKVRAVMLAVIMAVTTIAGTAAIKAQAVPNNYLWAKQGTVSDKVYDIELRLITLGYLKAPADKVYDLRTRVAVINFEKAEKLRVNGVVEQSDFYRLWQKSDAKRKADAAARAASRGTLWATDGTRSEKVRDIQLRLITLGYLKEQATGLYGPATKAAVINFQKAEKLEVTGKVYQVDFYRLWQRSDAKRKADAAAAPRGLDKRCLTGRTICVNKTTRKMSWVINGKVQQSWDVRTGRAGMETREGVFNVYWKSKNHFSTLYYVPMPFSLFFSGGQAVHYSADFASRGYWRGSAGCVNMRSWSGAEYLFNQTRVGDKVVVYH